MRVLIVSEGFDDNSIIAQPWRHMYELAHSMIGQRHVVAIATDSPKTYMRKETTVREIPTYVLPKTRLPPMMSPRMSTSEVQATIKELSPNVIYWDGGALVGNYIRKAKGIDKPVVAHISTNLYTIGNLRLQDYHSIDRSFLIYALTMSNPLGHFFVRLLNREPIKMITVPNRSIKEGLVKVGVSRERIEVLPTPFQREEIFLSSENSGNLARARGRIGLSPDDFVVAYFGPPRIYRGTDTLLYAAARLKHRLPQLKVALLLRTGKDSEDVQERLLRRIASHLRLKESVKFVKGILGKEDLVELLRASDAIALPFKFVLNEPPITALEAMVLGKPLIITSVSGLPELVGRHAFIVEPRNDSDLAWTLYSIAKNLEGANERGREAREHVLNLPSWNDYTKYVLRLFEGVGN